MFFSRYSPLRVRWVRIENIRRISTNQAYYDLTVPIAKHYLAHGIYHHNTAKTRSILSCLFAYAMNHPGAKIALCRSTRSLLTDSVMDTLETQVFPAFDTPVPGGAAQRNRSDYVLSNGSRFILRSLDSESRGQSFECVKIYISEVSELESINDALAPYASLRQPGYPSRQLIMDVNPVAPGHWSNLASESVSDEYRNCNIHTREDHHRAVFRNRMAPKGGLWKRIITTHKDNPGYWDADVWDWTKAGAAYMRTLEKYTGWLRSRWLDGLWRAASGTVFGGDFMESRNVIEPFDWPSEWPLFVRNDPGYDHPTAIVWLGVSPSGVVYVMDEIYEGGKSVEQHADSIRTHNRGRTIRNYKLDPRHGFAKTAQSPKTIAEQYARAGIQFHPWPVFSGPAVHAIVNDLRQRLGAGKFKIFSHCVNTIREFQSWSYKRTKGGVTPAGDDAFEDKDNHAIDAIRSFIAENPSFEQREIRVVH